MYISYVRNYHTAIISKLENGPRAVLSDMITKSLTSYCQNLNPAIQTYKSHSTVAVQLTFNVLEVDFIKFLAQRAYAQI